MRKEHDTRRDVSSNCPQDHVVSTRLHEDTGTFPINTPVGAKLYCSRGRTYMA